MKKIIIFILFITCLLVGCNSPKETEGTFNLDIEIAEVKMYKEANYMFDSEYQALTFTSKEDINDIKEELNAVKFKQIKVNSIDKKEIYDYIIKLRDDYVIYIIDDKEFFIYYKGEYNKCEIVEGSLNVFDLYYFGEKLEEIDKNLKFEDITYMTVKYNNIKVNVTSNNYIKNLFVTSKFYKNNESLIEDFILYQVVVNSTIYSIYSNGQLIEENETDMEPRKYFVNIDAFASFKELIIGEELSFDFNDIKKVKVYNKDDKDKEIEKIEEFISKINLVKYYQVKNTNDFIIGDVIYKIDIDGLVIGIYNNDIIIVGDKTCVVTEGNFDFLKDINFGGSSGWLPWV